MNLPPDQEEINELLKADRTKVVENHKEFIEKLGKPYVGVSKTKQKKHRTPNCYSCTEKLDNVRDDECNACGWIICKCGACGCGYDSNSVVDKPIERISKRRGSRDENGIFTP